MINIMMSMSLIIYMISIMRIIMINYFINRLKLVI